MLWRFALDPPASWKSAGRVEGAGLAEAAMGPRASSVFFGRFPLGSGNAGRIALSAPTLEYSSALLRTAGGSSTKLHLTETTILR